MNALLAQRLGRPDLVGVPTDPYGGSSGNVQVRAGASGSPGGLSLNAAGAGQVTGVVLVLMLAAVAGFYVWTRGIQA